MDTAKQAVPYRYIFTKNGPIAFIFVYALFMLAPLLLTRLLGVEHSNSALRELAVGSGMLALMLLLSLFWLSGRFNWASGVRGLDLTLKFHRRIAGLALVLIAVHLMVIIGFSLPKYMGLIAVGLLLVVLQFLLAKAHTKFKMNYDYWRVSHAALALVLVVVMVIHAIAEGHYSSHPLLRAYWVLLTLAAMGSLLYVHVWIPYQQRKRPYRVVEIKPAADSQWLVTLSPQGFKSMNFEAGQYAFVSFGRSPFVGKSHPFSFSSCPSDRPNISFTIKQVGDFTDAIEQIELGSNAYVYGPYGHLSLSKRRGTQMREKGIVLLAAGIGMTPIMSMLREMRAKQEKKPIKLFYACRFEQDLLYMDELAELAQELDLDMKILLSQPQAGWQGDSGRIDAEYLKTHINFEHHQDYLYFSCGTTPFIRSVSKGLEGVGGIPMFNIVFEDFSVYS